MGKRSTASLERVSIRMVLAVHRFVCSIQPWGVFATLAALVITLIGLMVDLEDRQSERVFRAWEVVLDASKILADSGTGEYQEVSGRGSINGPMQNFLSPPVLGSSVRQALQFLNEDFEKSGCNIIISFLSEIIG